MGDERVVGEARLEVLGREQRGDVLVGDEQLLERASFVGRAQGVALHQRVRILAGQAALLDERREDA